MPVSEEYKRVLRKAKTDELFKVAFVGLPRYFDEIIGDMQATRDRWLAVINELAERLHIQNAASNTSDVTVMIVDMKNSGAKYREIAEHLNNIGITTSKGTRWTERSCYERYKKHTSYEP